MTKFNDTDFDCSAIDGNRHQLFDNKIIWLNSKEAAEYLRISVENLRVKVSRGQIQVHGRLGRSWRFRREELDKLLETPTKGVFHD